MSTPSLLNIPYRLKAGTLYSQLPETGAGDFTVSRTTTPTAGQSTRINSLGNIELVANNVPRLDYPLGGAVNGCPALLVEPIAINSCLQSADFNTTWLAQNSATVNTNTAISPDGTQNADTINLAAISDSRVRQLITVANSTTYTISCFYKNIALTSGQTFRMRFNNTLTAPNNFIASAVIDLAAGTATYSLTGTSGTGFSGTATGRIENYGNGWYRVSVTFTVGTGGGAAGLFEAANVDAVPAVRSFYAWGAQLEASSVPTSYIPTTTASVTRSEDQIQRPSVSSLIGQTEGTFYFEGEANFAATDLPSLNRSITNSILLAKNASNQVVAYVYYGGVFLPIFATASAITGPFKAALAYKQGSPGDTAFFVNGVQAGSTNAANWAFTAGLNDVIVRADSYIAGGKPYKVRALGVYPNRIPNTAGTGVLSLTTLTT